MRAVWQLAINSLAGRASRTALLTIAITLATALAVVVTCAIGTLRHSYERSMAHVAGSADAQVRHRGMQLIDAKLLDDVRGWPGVVYAAGRLDSQGVALHPTTDQDVQVSADLQGVEPTLDAQFFPVRIEEGRDVAAPGQLVLDERIALTLMVTIGDTVRVMRSDVTLTVVGITKRPPLSVLQLPVARVTVADAQRIMGAADMLRSIQLRLTEDAASDEAGAFIARHKPALPDDAVLEPSAAVRAGINRAVRYTNLINTIANVLVGLAAVFIVVTGLTTAVNERTRELAIARCIGAGRLQLGAAQVLAGMLVTVVGAALGAPLGVLIARLLYAQHTEILNSGFVAPAGGLAASIGAVLVAGLIGALYPAWAAARVRPLEALSIRARQPSQRGVVICLILGLIGIAFQPLVILAVPDIETAFWIYLPGGLALLFVGYCLLCVPLLVGVLGVLSRGLAVILRLPRDLLRQTIAATPYRHGFTAGALMIGLAILVTIWTEGGNLLYGWFDSIKMPDAFMYTNPAITGGGTRGEASDNPAVLDRITTAFQTRAFPPEAMQTIRDHPDVEDVSGIIARRVLLTGVKFGVEGITPPFTIFAACDVEPFLRMTQVEWIEGDPETALPRIREGNAVLVGREFTIAHNLGVGAKLTLLTWNEGEVDFEIVGVVGATGLDVAVAHFGIGQTYAEASVGTVFGTLADGKRYWGSGKDDTGRFKMDDPELLLLDLRDEADAQKVLDELEKQCEPIVGGDIRSDSSRTIRDAVHALSVQLMAVASAIAIAALLISCLGVANLIMAEVRARTFEFGVLRAIGGQRGVLGRLVAAQTLTVAIIACLIGSLLGVQIGAIAVIFHARLIGVTYEWQTPWAVLLLGSATVLVMALAATAPAIIRLMRKPTTALLATEA